MPRWCTRPLRLHYKSQEAVRGGRVPGPAHARGSCPLLGCRAVLCGCTMSARLRFDGRVVLVTGAGGGECGARPGQPRDPCPVRGRCWRGRALALGCLSWPRASKPERPFAGRAAPSPGAPWRVHPPAGRGHVGEEQGRGLHFAISPHCHLVPGHCS